MTSYKVMVSNDSHTWVTIKNGSGDMVSLSAPLTPGLAVQAEVVRARSMFAPGSTQTSCRA